MNKGNPFALLPIGVFLALFISVSIWMDDFYVMPAIVGFLIALGVAFAQNPKVNFNEKLGIVSRGKGDENIMVMTLVFVLAGAFSASVTAAGGADSTVNFGLSILPGNIAVIGVFVIACFISVSMGTSVGTIIALAPIAIGISEKTGINMALCIGAAVCGAMFGDNLSMISDTTIAATRTQGCEMQDKFKENIKLVVPAVVITLAILMAQTSGFHYKIDEALPYDLIRIAPYLLVLIGAMVGLNVFALLAGGTALSLAVGLGYGDFALSEIFTIMGGGVAGMYEIAILSIVVAGVISLVRFNGGIDWILYVIRKSIRSKKQAELGIATLSVVTDIATANNTVAIVIAAPIAKEIAQEYDISPKRTASLLDIFTAVGQGLIPYGAQLLYAAAATAGTANALSPVEIMPYCYYPMLMGVSTLVFILAGKKAR